MRLNKETILTYTNFNALTNDIINLAREIMPDKVIYINFLNDEVQVTMRVSKHDTEVTVGEGITIPVEEAVCNQINYETGEPLVIEDISNNNFNEKVNQTIKDGNLGSYLGIPILFQNGTRFGALCAAHHDKSEFDPKDVALLQNIAKLFAYYLELENMAYKDALTGLHNKGFLHTLEERIMNNGGLLIMLDLDNFKEVNDTFGHDVGDDVLREVASKVNNFIGSFKDAYGIRLGGDEFIIYIKDKLEDDYINTKLVSLVETLRAWETPIGDVVLSSSVGALIYNPKQKISFDVLLKRVDELLYIAKRSGKDMFVFE